MGGGPDERERTNLKYVLDVGKGDCRFFYLFVSLGEMKNTFPADQN